MPSISTIKGLTPAQRDMVQAIFAERHYPIEPEYHPSVSGCWFQVFNPYSGDVVIIDQNTTVGVLQEGLGR